MAARAGACRALTCAAGFPILTPSHGMSPPSPCRHQNPVSRHESSQELTHVFRLPSPHHQCPTSCPTARRALDDAAPELAEGHLATRQGG